MAKSSLPMKVGDILHKERCLNLKKTSRYSRQNTSSSSFSSICSTKRPYSAQIRKNLVSPSQVSSMWMRRQPNNIAFSSIGSDISNIGSSNNRNNSLENNDEEFILSDDMPSGPDARMHYNLDGSDRELQLFGVDHRQHDSHIADWIIQHRPGVVVMESSATEDTQTTLGEVVEYSPDLLQCGPGGGGLLALLTRLAWQLRSAEFPNTPVSMQVWRDMSAALPSEQQVVVVAFALGVPVMWGDRPKLTTCRRLLHGSSLRDLDFAFGVHATQNFQSLIARCKAESSSRWPEIPSPVSPGSSVCSEESTGSTDSDLWGVSESNQSLFEETDCLTKVVIDERNLLLAHSLALATLDTRFRRSPGDVVGVLGASHLPGVMRAWQGRDPHSALLSQVELSSLLSSPSPPALSPEALGVKLGVFERMLLLKCSPEVIRYAAQTVEYPVSMEQTSAFEAVSEVYGSSRMLLASLPRHFLPQVVGHVSSDIDQMSTQLEQIRALRPVNGGEALDFEIMNMLRTLNFMLH